MKPKTIRVWVARDSLVSGGRCWMSLEKPKKSNGVLVPRGWCPMVHFDVCHIKPGAICRARLIIEPRGKK